MLLIFRTHGYTFLVNKKKKGLTIGKKHIMRRFFK